MGDTLTLQQLIGTACIVTGVYILVSIHSKKRAKETEHKKGVLFTLGGVILLSLGLIAEKLTLSYMDRGAYYIWGFGSQVFFTVLIALPYLKRTALAVISVTQYIQISAIGVLNAIGGALYIAILTKTNNISLTISLTAFVLPLTTLASFIILRERDHPVRTFSALTLGTAGVILCSL